MDYFALAAQGANNTTDGTYTGIVSGGAQVSAAAGNTTVGQLEYDDVLKLLWSVSARVLHKSPRFWAHPFILAKLMGIKDKNGRPIFMTYLEAPQFGSMGSLLGKPVTMADIAPYTDAPGSPVLSFGDPEGGYFALRSDFGFESSDHFKWDYYARSFRGIGRAGFVIRTDVGAAGVANPTTIPFATLNTAAA
jgi:HK97 family phage major capsid protein